MQQHLQEELREFSRAMGELNTQFRVLRFDPKDPDEITRAIQRLEIAVDLQAERFAGNALVEDAARKIKDRVRTAILNKARIA